MNKATTNTTLSEPQAKFMHDILVTIAAYAHEEQRRRTRAGRESRKSVTNRQEDV